MSRSFDNMVDMRFFPLLYMRLHCVRFDVLWQWCRCDVSFFIYPLSLSRVAYASPSRLDAVSVLKQIEK